MENIYTQILATAESAGIKIISDDKCCKILAVLYVHGGANSDFTYNKKLLIDIMESQRRLNILGGETPNVELTAKLKSYINELIPQGWQGKRETPKWFIDITSEYNIKIIDI